MFNKGTPNYFTEHNIVHHANFPENAFSSSHPSFRRTLCIPDSTFLWGQYYTGCCPLINFIVVNCFRLRQPLNLQERLTERILTQRWIQIQRWNIRVFYPCRRRHSRFLKIVICIKSRVLEAVLVQRYYRRGYRCVVLGSALGCQSGPEYFLVIHGGIEDRLTSFARVHLLFMKGNFQSPRPEMVGWVYIIM